ncbi:MAG TPA: MMPL family transporter [Polyangia bacterium]
MTGERKERARLQLAVAGVVALAMLAFCALRLRVTTDITHFLPAGTDHRLAELSRRLADSALTRTMILDVGGGDPAAVHAGAAALAGGLAQNREVAWLERGPTPALAESVYKLYAPRLPYFVSDHPETEVPAALSDAGLARAARALKQQMSSPLSPMLARLAPSDPLGWFPAILRRFERARAGSLDVDGDQLVTPDRRHAIVFLGTRHSAFDSAAQGPLLGDIDRAFADANRSAGGGLTLERAGVAPIAVDAERRMRGDLTRISALSTVGVVVVLLLLLGSLRGLLLAFLPVVAGALTAATVGLLLFGQVHGMTLAIGSTLIGVAIDYPILLLTHRALSPDETPEAALRRVWIGALLGGLTTAAGFVALAWTSFPGVREMAVTSAAGILAALAVTRFVLPPLLRARPRRAPLLARGAARGDRALAWLGAHRGLTFAITALALAVCALGLPRLRWLDSLAALNAADPALKAETDRVRARVSRVDEGRLVVASARDTEQALRINDAVADRLERARPHAPDGGIVSLHAFLWSAALQTRSRAAVAAVPDLAGRTLAALAREGFKPDAFAPFRRAIEALHAPAAEPPLRLADLQASPLASIVRPFTVQLGDDVGVLTFLRSVDRPGDVAAAVADLPGARVFDQARFLDETYARFRGQTLQAIGIGLALILLVLYLRYMRFRPALAALLPAALAGAATLAILGAAGVKTNLLHVLSLLLVLSIGVDYGVFLVEGSRHGPLGPTTMSLASSAMTTMLSFGLLAISSTPALRAIGLTTAIGISLSLLLAPTTLVLLRAGERP